MTLKFLHFDIKSKRLCAYHAPRYDDLCLGGCRIMMITYD